MGGDRSKKRATHSTQSEFRKDTSSSSRLRTPILNRRRSHLSPSSQPLVHCKHSSRESTQRERNKTHSPRKRVQFQHGLTPHTRFNRLIPDDIEIRSTEELIRWGHKGRASGFWFFPCTSPFVLFPFPLALERRKRGRSGSLEDGTHLLLLYAR